MNSTNQTQGVNNNNKSKIEVGRKTRKRHRSNKKEVLLDGYVQNRLLKCMKFQRINNIIFLKTQQI